MRESSLSCADLTAHKSVLSRASGVVGLMLALAMTTFLALFASCGSDSSKLTGNGIEQGIVPKDLPPGSGSEMNPGSPDQSDPVLGETYPGEPADLVEEVGIVRLDQSGNLSYTVESWTNWRIHSYMSSLQNCQSAEDALPILVQYDLVPTGITYADLQNTLASSLNQVLPSGTSLEILGSTMGSTCVDFVPCSGDGCVVVGKVQGPFFFSKLDPYYLAWVSFNGGWTVMACFNEGLCQCESTIFNAGLLVGGPMVVYPALPDVSFIWATDAWYGGMFAFAWGACAN